MGCWGSHHDMPQGKHPTCYTIYLDPEVLVFIFQLLFISSFTKRCHCIRVEQMLTTVIHGSSKMIRKYMNSDEINDCCIYISCSRFILKVI